MLLLQWSTQPIYVLDKDNDLNVSQLAAQNAGEGACLAGERQASRLTLRAWAHMGVGTTPSLGTEPRAP